MPVVNEVRPLIIHVGFQFFSPQFLGLCRMGRDTDEDDFEQV